MIFLVTESIPEGLKISGYCDIPEEYALTNYVQADLVPLPSSLVGEFDDWSEAINEGFDRFFTLNDTTFDANLVALTSWTENVDLQGITNSLTLNFSGEEVLVLGVPDLAKYITFLTTNYPDEHIAFSSSSYSWSQAQFLADSLIRESLMLLIMNSYVSSTPLSSDLQLLWTTLYDVESSYALPSQFITLAAGGIAAVAADLGITWPLP